MVQLYKVVFWLIQISVNNLQKCFFESLLIYGSRGLRLEKYCVILGIVVVVVVFYSY